ncbi:MAG: ABC transporter ATP-binding protein [Planctomycetes bacterium]|nr:ABC transporter ATP-binding protein [Planctomycetota bacterium]
MSSLLEVKDIRKHFGGVKAVDGLSFSINKNDICAIIGPNGSGKTTAINLITKVYPLSGGEVYLNGERIDKLSRAKIVRQGLVRTFQNLRLFSTLTVLQHVLVARYFRQQSGFVKTIMRLPSVRHEEEFNRRKAMELLDMVGLTDHANRMASSLPYGRRRLLEIARAIATEPKLILLDEPAAGMSEEEIDLLIGQIRMIRDMGMAVLVVEHRMRLIMNVAENIIVLNYGKKIAEGTAADIQDNQEVITAYLGKYHQKVETRQIPQKG